MSAAAAGAVAGGQGGGGGGLPLFASEEECSQSALLKRIERAFWCGAGVMGGVFVVKAVSVVGSIPSILAPTDYSPVR